MYTHKLPAKPAALFSITVGSGGLHMMISSWSDIITTPGNCGNHTRTCTKPCEKATKKKKFLFFSSNNTNDYCQKRKEKRIRYRWELEGNFGNTTSDLNTHVSPEHAAPRKVGDQQVVREQRHVRQVGPYLTDGIDHRIDRSIVGEQRMSLEAVGFLQPGRYHVFDAQKRFAHPQRVRRERALYFRH